jgi:hypothetical protein
MKRYDLCTRSLVSRAPDGVIKSKTKKEKKDGKGK